MRSLIYSIVLTLIIACGTTIAEEPTCHTRCVSDCEASCRDAIVCTEEELDCGEGPKCGGQNCGGFCEHDRLCVAKNCECPAKDSNGDDCPTICLVECSVEEIHCAGRTDDKGCKQPSSCVTKDRDNEGSLCTGVCPLTCQGHELQCGVAEDANGCQQPPVCVSKGQDNGGNDCPGVCPVVCETDSTHCGSEATATGCAVVDTCVAKGTDNHGELCPGTCPVHCSETDILCVGPIESNGCKMTDVCHPKARDTNGEFCPDDSASHNCPVSCMENEALCPGYTTALGCKGTDECKEKTKDAAGEFCPDTSVCRTPCKLHEISCPGGIDIIGCKKPDTCLPRGRDFNDELCPVHCPGECTETELMCPGETNTNGCKDPDACAGRGTKSCGPNIGDLCPGHCPVQCGQHEIKCPSQLDPCDCCETEEVCRVKAKNINGEDCPDDSDSHDCPRYCDELNGQVLCPAYEDNLGCKPRALCMAKSLGADGRECPSYSVCPKECGSEEMLCADGVDSNNCKNADRCLPRGRSHDLELCPIQCPPVCLESQVKCEGQIRANGCKDIDSCVDKVFGNDGAQCRTVCPVSCSATETVVAGTVDENGCPTVDTCVASKILGEWTNEGSCIADGDDATCGTGTQKQGRTCMDGTIDVCTDAEKQRDVTCVAAGTALPVCITCPDDFIQFQRKCYMFSADVLTFSEARTACQALDGGYDLVSIDNSDLAAFIKQHVDHWIGLSDLDDEGTYKWVNGNSLDFASALGEDPWNSGEPNDSSGEDCVHTNANGLWNDNKCSAALKYICGPAGIAA